MHQNRASPFASDFSSQARVSQGHKNRDLMLWGGGKIAAAAAENHAILVHSACRESRTTVWKPRFTNPWPARVALQPFQQGRELEPLNWDASWPCARRSHKLRHPMLSSSCLYLSGPTLPLLTFPSLISEDFCLSLDYGSKKKTWRKAFSNKHHRHQDNQPAAQETSLIPFSMFFFPKKAWVSWKKGQFLCFFSLCCAFLAVKSGKDPLG